MSENKNYIIICICDGDSECNKVVKYSTSVKHEQEMLDSASSSFLFADELEEVVESFISDLFGFVSGQPIAEEIKLQLGVPIKLEAETTLVIVTYYA